MNCREAHSLFSAKLDGELSACEARDLELHVLRCDDCDAQWKSISLTVQLVRSIPAPALDPGFVCQVMDRVRAHEIAERREKVLSGRRVSPIASLVSRAQNWIETFSLRPILRPVPVAVVTALTFGLVTGYLAQDPVSDWTGAQGRNSRLSAPSARLSDPGAAGTDETTRGGAHASNPAGSSSFDTSRREALGSTQNTTPFADALAERERGFATGSIDSLVESDPSIEVLAPDWWSAEPRRSLIQQTRVQTF